MGFDALKIFGMFRNGCFLAVMMGYLKDVDFLSLPSEVKECLQERLSDVMRVQMNNAQRGRQG